MANKKKKSDDIKIEDISGLWIIPYADFMTTLMIFFMMMFVFAAGMKDEHYKRIVSGIQESVGGKMNREQLEKIIDEERDQQAAFDLKNTIKQQDMDKYIEVKMDAEQIKIVFSNPVLFDSGKSDLKSEAIKILKGVGKLLRNMPNEIIVEGHTDNVPITGGKFKSNWELSVARALEVIRYLVHNETINFRRFAAAGYGEFRPLFTNDTEENKAKNRRIEIIVFRNKSISTQTQLTELTTTQTKTGK